MEIAFSDYMNPLLIEMDRAEELLLELIKWNYYVLLQVFSNKDTLPVSVEFGTAAVGCIRKINNNFCKRLVRSDSIQKHSVLCYQMIWN